MKNVVRLNKFEKDYRRSIRRNKDERKLIDIVLLLAQDEPLPARCRPHKLSGEYEGLWECHIEPDWLLIYYFDEEEDQLILARTGTHSDLF